MSAFHLLPAHGPVADPVAHDSALLDTTQQPVASLWACQPSLVVPRSYANQPRFEQARADSARRGWPVHVRASGGGLVPQGPGMLNLSLVYAVEGGPGRWMETVYHHLCGLLLQALTPLGLHSHWQAVPGSFCDGRFNLACGTGEAARKIAGTAQYWRPLPAMDGAPRRHRVLAHALLLVTPDLDTMHQRANTFEHALGSGRCYDPQRTVSVAQLLGATDERRVMDTVRDHLARAVQQAGPPRLNQLPQTGD